VNDVEQAIRERVHAVVAAMAPQRHGAVADETDLRFELGYDSLRLMELVIALERGFTLPPIDMEAAFDAATVGDVVRLVSWAAGPAAETAAWSES
jgi:acyl carrier protein